MVELWARLLDLSRVSLSEVHSDLMTEETSENQRDLKMENKLDSVLVPS